MVSYVLFLGIWHMVSYVLFVGIRLNDLVTRRHIILDAKHTPISVLHQHSGRIPSLSSDPEARQIW